MPISLEHSHLFEPGLRRLNTCTWWSATNLGLSASNKILEPRFSQNELYEEIFLYHDTTTRFSGWYSAFVPAHSLPPTRPTTKISTPILSPSRPTYTGAS